MDLTEEELEIYDLLIKDRKLTKAEEQKVILAAKNLYHKLVAERESIMVIDWYKDEQPKQKVISNHFIDIAVQGYGWIAA